MPEPDLALAERLFNDLARATRQGRGIVRDTYGEGEQAAHDIVAAAARAAGLETSVDAIGNLFMTLSGRDRQAPIVLMGSHLDSVPQGGNYDGAAGVVAGLAILSGWRAAGFEPARDTAVMAIRAEESAWFDVPYLGSAGAFGLIDPAALEVRRSGDGVRLEDALQARGFDPEAIRERRRLLHPQKIAAFLELHIEQGPVLIGEDVPVAVVTGIRGCRRLRACRCIGAYGHSGALPRAYRQDAVAATIALLARVEADWVLRESEGVDLVVTSGELFTDPAHHGPSKVAGETRFVVDIRSVSDVVMEEMEARVRAHAEAVSRDYRVSFDLGTASYSPPAPMDATLQARLAAAIEGQGVRAFSMASGAGHDAAVFAGQGVPTAMLFVRNQNGSHNPDEAMAFGDFAVGVRVVGEVVKGYA